MANNHPEDVFHIECSSTFKTVDQLVDMAAEMFPNETAIAFGNQQVMYQDLIQSANQIAHYLLSCGVLSEQIVGICLERSPQMLMATLGILKAGGAYLPLDPTHPPARLQFVLKDSGASFLFTKSSFQHSFQDFSGKTILYDKISQNLTNYPLSNPNILKRRNSLAYVIYTSGTTGTPKGVLIEHKGIPNYAIWLGKIMKVSNCSKVLLFASLSYDSSVHDIFVALTYGACLVVPHPGIILIGDELQNIILDFDITHLTCPPVVWSSLDPNLVGSLEVAVFCGETASKSLLHTWSEKAHVFNCYGPTEITVAASIAAYSEAKSADNIGSGLPNVKIYILDNNLHPVEKGIIGELFISGVGVARGYHNRPELTAQKFIDNTLEQHTCGCFQKLYRTGDLARFTDEVEFLRRADYQVKVCGFRIELGEIEAALNTIPKIKMVVAIVKEDVQTKNKTISAYITWKDKIQSDDVVQLTTDLRSNLKNVLPYYMVPSQFFFLDHFPLTAGGKVDRQALTKLQSSINLPRRAKTTKSVVEEALYLMWSDVLGLESVDLDGDDDFFQLGGNSFKAALLCHLIEAQFGFNTRTTYIYENPTIGKLTQFIENHEYNQVAERIDFFKEGSLDLETVFGKKPAEQIFFTGATGYIGAHLLADLLKITDSNFHCLVRGKSVEEAEARLKSILLKYKIWDNSFKQRITVVLGDLRKWAFGLQEVEFNDLASMTDVIYHAAADVNYAKPYSALKLSIVSGTQWMLTFATRKRLKIVHHISTVGMFGCSFNFHPVDEFTEDMNIDDVADSLHIEIGYDQAKWVAEKLVFEARSNGLPVIIYRPGFAYCHSQTGIANEHDFWARMVKGCAKMGVFPSLEKERMEFCTVDYISQAIAYISLQRKATGKVFHITPPTEEENLATDDFFAAISEHVKMEKVPYSEWVCHLREYIKDMHIHNPLLPLASMLTHKAYNDKYLLELYQNMPHKNCKNTISFLENSPVKFIRNNKQLMANYVNFLLGE